MDLAYTIAHINNSMRSISIRLPDDTVEYLQQEAERTGSSVSEVGRRVIDLYRDRTSEEFSFFVQQAAIFFERENANVNVNSGLGEK